MSHLYKFFPATSPHIQNSVCVNLVYGRIHRLYQDTYDEFSFHRTEFLRRI